MQHKRALFTTSEIQNTYIKNYNPSYVYQDGETFYSTGALENALSQNYEIFVITTRPRFLEHDGWWLELVNHHNIIVPTKELSKSFKDDRYTILLEQYRLLYKKLNIIWNNTFIHYMDAKINLYNHGVLLGNEFMVTSRFKIT